MLLAIVQSTLQKGIAHDFSKVDHVLVSFIKEQKTYPWLQQYFLWTTEKAEEEKEEKEGSLTSRLRFQTFHRAFTISRNGLKLLLHASCLPASVCSSRYFPGPGDLLKNPPSKIFLFLNSFRFILIFQQNYFIFKVSFEFFPVSSTEAFLGTNRYIPELIKCSKTFCTLLPTTLCCQQNWIGQRASLTWHKLPYCQERQPSFEVLHSFYCKGRCRFQPYFFRKQKIFQVIFYMVVQLFLSTQ